MSTALYRLSSGEVMKVSLSDQPFTDRDVNYWGVAVDPSLPDGNVCVDPSGDYRVLGYAKIHDAGTVRNAIQAEIDTFEAAQLDDESQEDADEVSAWIDSHPRFRKIFKAILKELIDELFTETNGKINVFIDQWNQFKLDVAIAANLSQLKDSVVALPAIDSDLKDSVTLSQAVTKLKNQIDKDD